MKLDRGSIECMELVVVSVIQLAMSICLLILKLILPCKFSNGQSQKKDQLGVLGSYYFFLAYFNVYSSEELP